MAKTKKFGRVRFRYTGEPEQESVSKAREDTVDQYNQVYVSVWLNVFYYFWVTLTSGCVLCSGLCLSGFL